MITTFWKTSNVGLVGCLKDGKDTLLLRFPAAELVLVTVAEECRWFMAIDVVVTLRVTYDAEAVVVG